MQNIINSLKREKLVATSNIFAMTVTFLFLGVFISAIAASQTLLRTLEKQAQVTVFFKDDFKEADILNIKTSIEADPRVYSVTYVSKENALEIFKALNKNDPEIIQAITANILPASLEIKAKNIKDLAGLAQLFEKNDSVEEIVFMADTINKFKVISTTIYVIGFTLAFVFLIISFTAVVVALRLTIANKGRELEILKLVGASDNYIKKPLIHQGVFFGVVSASLASCLLATCALILKYGKNITTRVEFAFFPNLSVGLLEFSLGLSAFLILVGLALGYFGSQTAINKYLKY